MSQRTPRSSSASPRAKPRPPRKADLPAPDSLKATPGGAGLEGLVETLPELRAEVMLRVLEASILRQTKEMNMEIPERTLTAEAGLLEVQKLPNSKHRLKNRDAAAVAEAKGFRDRVVAKELQKFDDSLEKWLKER